MSQSPMRPYSLANAHGKVRIWGGEGEREDKNQSGGSGGTGEGQDDPITGDPDIDARIRDAEKRAEDNEKKAKEAEKRAADLEKAQKDAEREGMEEHERTAAERDDYKEKYEKLLKIVETSYLDTAIMKVSAAKNKDGTPKYEWYDAEAVRTFIDKEAIKLNQDTGEVEGLDAQLKEIASKRPYLLVSKETRDGGQGGPPPPQDGPPTGSHPYGGNTHQSETDKQKLAKKYKFNHLVVGGSPR